MNITFKLIKSSLNVCYTHGAISFPLNHPLTRVAQCTNLVGLTEFGSMALKIPRWVLAFKHITAASSPQTQHVATY